ncbi:hypothetical protein [uncultured Victivallis sp.]|uniref:hypothetical protein n=1 Tax=uncultured Victivallis sp. TaxID=354118 RepID=UPI0025F9B862|nr:hypothetical protein [uncultured Victivallis sp.]
MRIECSHGSEVRKSLVPGIIRNLFIFFFLTAFLMPLPAAPAATALTQERKVSRKEVMGVVDPPNPFTGSAICYSLNTRQAGESFTFSKWQTFKNHADGLAEFNRVSAGLETHCKVKGERTLSNDPTMVFRFSNGRVVLKLNCDSESSSLEIRGDLTDLEEPGKAMGL